ATPAGHAPSPAVRSSSTRANPAANTQAKRLRCYARFSQLLPHRCCVMRKGNFWLLDLGMPALFPFEAVIAFVPVPREHPHGLLNRNVSGAGKHVATVILGFSRNGHRVLQVRVPRVFAQLSEGVRGLLPFDARVVRVPKKCDVLR